MTVIPGLIAVVILLFHVEDTPYERKEKYQHWHSNDSKTLPILGIYLAFIYFIFSSSFYVIKAINLGYSIVVIPLFYILLNLVLTMPKTSLQFMAFFTEEQQLVAQSVH